MNVLDGVTHYPVGKARRAAMMRLRELRLKRCWTQTQLAARANLGLATLKQIETGRHPARLSTIAALAQALDMDTAELAGLHFR